MGRILSLFLKKKCIEEPQNVYAVVKYNTPQGFNCVKKLPVVIAANGIPDSLSTSPTNLLHVIKNGKRDFLLIGRVSLMGGMKKRDLFGSSFESKESKEQKMFDKAFGIGEYSAKSEYNPVREGLRSNGLDYVDIGGKAFFTKYDPIGILGEYGGLSSKSYQVGSSTIGGFENSQNHAEGLNLLFAYIPVQGNSIGETIARVAEGELQSKNWGLLSSNMKEDQYIL